MKLAESAFLARENSDFETYTDFTQSSYYKEVEAALLASEHNVGEPTESVLLRSAATLALEHGKKHDAMNLIQLAFIGTPPPEIAAELKELLINVIRTKFKGRY